MWNPFKKKDPMKATAGVYHLAETFIPQLVKSAIDGAVSRDDVIANPLTVGGQVEVILWARSR